MKLPIGVLQGNTIDLSESCENEWLCLSIARSFGLEVCSAEIVQFGSARALSVKRFDRKKTQDGKRYLRLPTEDFCQVFAKSKGLKYEADGGPGIANIARMLQYSSAVQKDIRTLFSTQILFWLLEATDGHAKNFSIFLEPGGTFRLTPLYDIMSVAPLTATGALPKRKVKLAMGLLGKNKHYRIADIEPRHFVTTAKAIGIPESQAREIMANFAHRAPSVVTELQSELPKDFPATTSATIFESVLTKAAKLSRFLSL